MKNAKKSLLHNVKKYKAVKVTLHSKSFVCGVGDFVHLRAQGGARYVARILDLFADSKGEKCSTMRWLYRANDVQVQGLKAGSKEIFYAHEHLDKSYVSSILE